MKEQKWPGTCMALGIFIGLFSMLYVGHRTVVGIDVLLRGLALFSCVGAVLPYAISGLRIGMDRLEWVFFNLLAVGPIIMSLLLWTNFLLHDPERCTEHHVTSDAVVQVPDASGGMQEITVPRSEGWIPMGGEEEGATTYSLCVAKGCLGYWTITERHYVQR